MSPMFKYHTRDAKGIALDGQIEAVDQDDAANKLKGQGLVVISVEMIGVGKPETIKEEVLNVSVEKKQAVALGDTMKTIAKWVAILWSIFCLYGVISGIARVGKNVSGEASTGTVLGTGLGMGCGLTIWLVFWLAIAGPAVFIWLLSGKKQPTEIKISEAKTKEATLCRECGKYYEDKPKFCPNCGKAIS